MKNEKVSLYVVFLQLCYTDMPYPAYELFKPMFPYFVLTESAEEIAFDPDYMDEEESDG